MNHLKTVACLLMLGSLAFAQENIRLAPTRPVIVVTGNGEVAATPDRAVVRLGAVAQDKDAAKAQDKVNRIVQKALDQIAALGVKKQKIRTDQVSLRPIYGKNDDNDPDFPQSRQKIVGYEASNVLQITLEKLSQIGPVIDAGVQAGADDIEGVDFQLADDTSAMQDALKRASLQAKAKAQAIADALQVKLGSIAEVQEAGVQRVMPMAYGRGVMMMAAKAAPTLISPGEIKITDQVTVTYRINE